VADQMKETLNDDQDMAFGNTGSDPELSQDSRVEPPLSETELPISRAA